MAPRLDPVPPEAMTRGQKLLVDTCSFNGAPDAAVASILVRSEIGRQWLRTWNEVLNGGVVPVAIKEMCRVYLSARHQCGYCATVRSRVAAAEGLTEEKLIAALDFEDSPLLSEREKAALRFAAGFLGGEDGLDSDSAFADVRAHFSDEEVIELALLCGETAGVGRFARALRVRSWDEACALQPGLRRTGEDPAVADAKEEGR